MSEQSYEHKRAIMEGERNASVAALEKAEILGPHDTRPYEMGFTNGWDRALSTHHAAPAGEVVVTKNSTGQIVAVTRQDEEGRVLSVIAQSEVATAPAAPQGMTIAGDGASMLGKLMREQRASRLGVYPDGNPNASVREATAPAGGVTDGLYVEVRECSECGHVGINDDNGTSACNSCSWSGPSPKEDKCPECEREGTMTTACPECGARSILLASATLTTAARAAEPDAAAEIRIDFKQAAALLECFGGAPQEMTLWLGVGWSGRGLYVHATEYPEDGAHFLGLTDGDATPPTGTSKEGGEKP
ncbi:MAG: hypothetical protein DI563_19380 [Variovorax paradoxus]|uniref:Uncharacterized protein n=1 Tax=Variovorax paradoxus TaxID=34073 RepID=A0A2W5RQN5_VARPD|nr:MAG: hypothetical protein DI563_19380 [Variovorax paradoxus]